MSDGNTELEPGVVIIPGPPTIIVQRRSPLLLNCSAFSSTGFGQTTYRWTRNKVAVTLNKRIQLIENGSLYFQHLKRRKRPSRSDEGLYECFLNNIKGVVIGRQVFVKVARNTELEPGVVIIPGPPTIIVQRRSPLLLNCSAFSSTGFGQTTYRWTRNKVAVTLNKRIQLIENGSLYFQHLKRRKRPSRSDEGLYECFLNNIKGVVIGRQVFVKVARIASKFTKMPVDQTTVVGGVARFECKIEATPPPVFIWEKDDASLPINNRTTTLASGVLQIHNVLAEDAGTYHCSAQHSFKDIANLHETVTSMSRRRSEAGVLTVTKGRIYTVTSMSRRRSEAGVLTH
ncbi:protogenin A-like [Pecten maximus]|uniref:protogenin A-like n=1 Tax=Pecten maximus TaxID=6579 RepID=UPI001458811A|nr:protogenin A-like [Pecten maximus]